ncbi:MAG: phage tail tube protein [Deltaproteobacteria bacterium]
MATPTTAEKHQVVIQVEWDPIGAPGVYTGWCGMEDMKVNRSTKTEETEVSDCSDRSLPKVSVSRVTGLDVTISGTGNWALESSSKALKWYKAGSRLNVRVWHALAASGDVEYEIGEALITSLNTANIFKGPVISEEIELKLSNYDQELKAISS